MTFTRKQAEWFYLRQQKKRRKSGSSPVHRYFTDLVAAGGMYYQFSSPITLSGDFEIELRFATTGLSVQIILGDSHITAYYFNISATLNVWVAGTERKFNFITDPRDGKLHNLIYKLTGNSLQVFIDGVSLGSKTIVPYLGANRFRLGNSNSATAPFNGVLSDLKIWTNGDRNTGTLVVDCPVDEAAGVNTIANLANPANPLTRVNQPLSATELYTLNTATTPYQWENADKTKIIPIAGT